MSLLRAFIAIEIPEEIKKKLVSQTASLQRMVGRSVRWVPPENVHLTLKFLGDVSLANIDFLVQALQAEAIQHPDFEITIENLGAFPNPRRPRVIWIGINAPANLSQLQHSIEAATSRLGYPVEDKPFSPHLTIGRVREAISPDEAQSLRSALENTRVGLLGKFAAKSVHLFRSDLQPGGPVYTCLSTAALGG